jgi:flagellar assembly protein FliH
MTWSSDTHGRPVSRRSARVLRGPAVETAQLAALHVEHAHEFGPSRRRSPSERLEEVRQDAYDEGYQAGLEAARTSAQEGRQVALRRGAEALRQAASAIEAGRANAIAVVEEDAAQLAVELTRTLVDHELSLTDDAMSAAVRRALRLTAPGEDLVVRLHPDEVVDAGELQPYVTDCRITVVPDPEVEHGGCVIDAGPCRIDAQIDSALARVRWALLASSRPSDTVAAAEPPPVESHQPVEGAQ